MGRIVSAFILLLALCLAYVPDLGHGFIKDDFMWIRTARVHSVTDAAALLKQNVGFYRPVVSATFAVNYALWGMNPSAYAFTNFGLLLLAACLLFMVGKALDLPDSAALLAAALWVFNFHGVNMAILWSSGRTALLLCCAALAATVLVLNGRMLLAGLFCLIALLSKEEAVVLPFLLAWCVTFGRPRHARRVEAFASTWPLFGSLLIYAVLRHQSGAFGPTTAPPYYQFASQPSLLLRNVLEYVDRGATWPIFVGVVLMAAARRFPASPTCSERLALAFAALWFGCGYALTVFIPVRSSLYALFPSVGACIAIAVIASRLLRQEPTRVRRTLAAVVVLPLLLLPVYRARNIRWVNLANLSTTAMRQVSQAAEQSPNSMRVVLIDNPTDRFNLDATFGTLFPDAVTLVLGERFQGEILPSERDIDGREREGTILLVLRGGRLEPLHRGVARFSVCPPSVRDARQQAATRGVRWPAEMIMKSDDCAPFSASSEAGSPL
jgi:hypothetical protein